MSVNGAATSRSRCPTHLKVQYNIAYSEKNTTVVGIKSDVLINCAFLRIRRRFPYMILNVRKRSQAVHLFLDVGYRVDFRDCGSTWQQCAHHSLKIRRRLNTTGDILATSPERRSNIISKLKVLAGSILPLMVDQIDATKRSSLLRSFDDGSGPQN